MTIGDIAREIATLDQTTETSVGEVKMVYVDKNYRCFSFVPASELEVEVFQEGLARTKSAYSLVEDDESDQAGVSS